MKNFFLLFFLLALSACGGNTTITEIMGNNGSASSPSENISDSSNNSDPNSNNTPAAQTPITQTPSPQPPALAPSIDRGRQLYSQHACDTCHGSFGEGPTPLLQQTSSESLIQEISDTMPTILGDPDDCIDQCAQDITAYIKSWPEREPIATPSACTNTEINRHGNSPLRLLTPRQYSRLLTSAFHPINIPIQPLIQRLPVATSVGGFANNAGTIVEPTHLDTLFTIADTTAQSLLDNLGQILSCQKNRQCISPFIRQYGKKLFRRQINNNDIQQKLRLFDDAIDFDEGFKQVVQALLLSPETLYQYEKNAEQRRKLSGIELASKLSFFIWNEAPTEQLINKAIRGELDSLENLTSTAETMLNDGRAYQGIQFFYKNWLGIKSGTRIEVNGKILTEKMLSADISRFAAHYTLNSEGSFHNLMTSNIAFVDNNLAPLYDVRPQPQGKRYKGGQEASLNKQERSGLLTRIGYLAADSKNVDTSPTFRGVHFRERLLCQEIPSPGPDIQGEFPQLPQDRDHITPAELLLKHHLSNPDCASCHEFMDPVGVGFEIFDGLGQFRQNYTLPNGSTRSIEEGGDIVAMKKHTSDITGPFANIHELSEKVANSQTAQACFVREWTQHALLRSLSSEDQCQYEALVQSFRESQLNLKDLILTIIRSPSFRFRNPE